MRATRCLRLCRGPPAVGKRAGKSHCRASVRCAIRPIIAQRTDVRKRALQARFPASGGLTSTAVRVPRTVHVKTLYCLRDQDYCRHHIIRAGTGPAVAMPRE